MPHFNFLNVNHAFDVLVRGIADGSIPTVKSPSRVGDVLVIPEPVIITYLHPLQNVLFNPYRDSNPFFHLYESLWMLAGRNDVAPLSYYNSQIADIASDDGETFNGAYGYRWRNMASRPPIIPLEGPGHDLVYVSDTVNDHMTVVGGVPYFDQLGLIVDHLKRNPTSRRVVLQMWTVADDLLKVDKTKDVACNVCAFFSIRSDFAREDYDTHPVRKPHLDMTVINRSNDIIWGMLGANAVHFAFLQEYLACSLGVEVGVYNQISNNAHVYTERFTPEKWFRVKSKPITMHDPPEEDDTTPYEKTRYNRIPLAFNVETFDREVEKFVELNKDGNESIEYGVKHNYGADWEEPYFNQVAQPMMNAYHMHKVRDYSTTLRWMEQVQADDWRKAGFEWIMRRKINWEKKGGKDSA